MPSRIKPCNVAIHDNHCSTCPCSAKPAGIPRTDTHVQLLFLMSGSGQSAYPQLLWFLTSLSLSLSAVASRGSSSARQRVRLKPLRPLTKRKQQAALQAAGNADICQAHTSAFTFAAHSQLKHETSTTTPASRTSALCIFPLG